MADRGPGLDPGGFLSGPGPITDILLWNSFILTERFHFNRHSFYTKFPFSLGSRTVMVSFSGLRVLGVILFKVFMLCVIVTFTLPLLTRATVALQIKRIGVVLLIGSTNAYCQPTLSEISDFLNQLFLFVGFCRAPIKKSYRAWPFSVPHAQFLFHSFCSCVSLYVCDVS